MAYCRNNGKDSDVYLIGTHDYLQCFGAGWRMERRFPVHSKCFAVDWHLDTLTEKRYVGNDDEDRHVYDVSEDYFNTTSRQEMIDHLLIHRAMGHKVPEDAIDRLREEIAEVGDTY